MAERPPWDIPAARLVTAHLLGLRAEGWAFGAAWGAALGALRCPDEDRRALEATKKGFRRAYERREPTGPERALTLVAASRGGIPIPDEDESAQPEADRPRCGWCGDPLPDGHKPSIRFCPPPKRCRREHNYAAERARSRDRTGTLRAVSGACRPTSGSLAAIPAPERNLAA